MKVLFVAGECDPFVKSGGLGDVIGALPKYLKKDGVDVRVVIPKYSDISQNIKSKMRFIKSFIVQMSWRNQYCGILEYEKDEIIYYFIDNEFYFKRNGIYGFEDDGERFAFFDRAVLMMLKELDYKPNIIHCHDWHTGMIPVLYNYEYKYDDFYKDILTIYTIHNLKFQGVFPKYVLGDWFNLNNELYDNDTLKFYDSINFMKGAIKTADKITTVSKTYSEEIKIDFFGEGLQNVILERSNDLIGIENGIDYTIYDPSKDDLIQNKFSKYTLNIKKLNKLFIQKELGLKVDEDIPMIAMVSRLTSQKGLDILVNCLEEIINENIQFVVLGTGEKKYEDFFRNLAYKYPSKISAIIDFDNILSHKIYAASDIFLMPSLFEPCGLGQLIALRYGSIPIVRETGGLKDTIHFYDKVKEIGNGFTFYDYNEYELKKTIYIALEHYKNKEVWEKLIFNAMDSENSWNKSAGSYKKLYGDMINKKI